MIVCHNSPKCYICGGSHEFNTCIAENPECVHCEAQELYSDHTAIDYENCEIYRQEYQLANNRLYQLVIKFNEKNNNDWYKVPGFKNNRLFDINSRFTKKPRVDDNLNEKLTALEQKCEQKINDITTKFNSFEEKVDQIQEDYDHFKLKVNKIDSIDTKLDLICAWIGKQKPQ